MDCKSCCVSFIYQLEDEAHTENNQIHLHPLKPYSPANNFYHAQQISNGKKIMSAIVIAIREAVADSYVKSFLSTYSAGKLIVSSYECLRLMPDTITL